MFIRRDQNRGRSIEPGKEEAAVVELPFPGYIETGKPLEIFEAEYVLIRGVAISIFRKSR